MAKKTTTTTEPADDHIPLAPLGADVEAGEDESEAGTGADAQVSDATPTPTQGRRRNKPIEEAPEVVEPVAEYPKPAAGAAIPGQVNDPQLSREEKARASRQAQEDLENGEVVKSPADKVARDVNRVMRRIEQAHSATAIDPSELPDDVEVLRKELISHITGGQNKDAVILELRGLLTVATAKAEAVGDAKRQLGRFSEAVATKDAKPVSGGNLGNKFLYALPMTTKSKAGGIGKVMFFVAQQNDDLSPKDGTMEGTYMDKEGHVVKDGTGLFYICRS